MKLKFMGVGAGFSKGLGNNNAMIYNEKPEDGYYLIDCGETTRVKLVDEDLIDSLKGVIITHLHGDHYFGLEMLGFWFYFVKQKPLPVYIASQEMAHQLWMALAPSMAQISDKEGNALTAKASDFFDFQIDTSFGFLSEDPTDNGFDITFREADHVINKECYGLDIVVDGVRHYYTSDQARPIWKMDWWQHSSTKGYIWHDCQLYDGGKTGVHAFHGDLKKDLIQAKVDYPDAKDNKLFLMHYNRPVEEEEKSDARTWCGGFVEVDQVFNLEQPTKEKAHDCPYCADTGQYELVPEYGVEKQFKPCTVCR